MKIKLLLLLFLTCSVSAFTGYWYTPNNESIVSIEEDAGHYSGKIVWLKDPLDTNGKPWTDSKNPSRVKRSRPIVGLPLLSDFKKQGKLLKRGTIYDPNSGKTYSCTISKHGETLKVRGYIGISLLGRTEKWIRCNLLPMEVTL